MSALEMIHRPAVTIDAGSTISMAAQQMEQAGVGCLCVVDANALVGIVTDRDLVRRAMARGLPADTRVDSIMTSPPISVAATADMKAVFDTFRQHALRRLPIVDADGVRGLITVDDILVVLSRQLEDVVRPVTAELLFAQHDSPVPAVPA